MKLIRQCAHGQTRSVPSLFEKPFVVLKEVHLVELRYSSRLGTILVVGYYPAELYFANDGQSRSIMIGTVLNMQQKLYT